MSFEEAKQILQMEDNGTSLYDHLSQVRLSAAWAAGQAAAPTLPAPARNADCAPLLEKLRRKGVDVSAGDKSWVLLSAFLQAVKQPGDHAARYVDGTSPLSWKRPGGGKPLVRKDYMKRPGPRGGGRDGLLHCRLGFLKSVSAKYYAQ